MTTKDLNITDDVINSLKNIAKDISELPVIKLSDLSKDNTLIIHVDIVNGFVKFGALSSTYVLDMLPHVIRLNEMSLEYDKVFILDSHEENAEEFKTYPPHCVINTKEDELVEELKKYTKGNAIVRKNSTNAIHSDELITILNNKKYFNFIVVGDVTDICVLQFALALKTLKNEQNMASRVIIPYTMIDTFENKELNHNRTLMNIFGIYNMIQSGIEVVADIL